MIIWIVFGDSSAYLGSHLWIVGAKLSQLYFEGSLAFPSRFLTYGNYGHFTEVLDLRLDPSESRSVPSRDSSLRS